jgi:hypothetical protein
VYAIENRLIKEAKQKSTMTSNQSIVGASDNLHLETKPAPSFECVLDDSDDESVSKPPSKKSPIWRTQAKDVEASNGPPTRLIEKTDSIEAEMLPDSQKMGILPRIGRRKLCWVAFACLLVALTIMGIVLGVQRSQEDEDTQSFNADALTGVEEEQDGGDVAATPTAGKLPFCRNISSVLVLPSSAPLILETNLLTLLSPSFILMFQLLCLL